MIISHLNQCASAAAVCGLCLLYAPRLHLTI